jgi:integrase
MAKVRFTAKRLQDFTSSGKAQAFLWDSMAPGLGYRVTVNGSRALIFQSRLDGHALRMTIGDPKSWTIDDAQAEARRLQGLIDQGKDPRQEKAATIAADQADRAAAKLDRQRLEALGVTAWGDYCAAKASKWGDLSKRDHERAMQEGGENRKRFKGKKTQPGPLRALLSRPLVQIDAESVEAWVKAGVKLRPTVTAKNFRLLRGFINWCAEHKEYAPLVQVDACKAKKTRQAMPKASAKDDALQREQLPSWFAEVRKQSNPIISAYLQTLLLTGARREELLGLKWSDVDFQWGRLTIRDKVEGERTIPLTPYVSSLLTALPRRHLKNQKPNPWVFSSPTAASGRLQDPRINHNKALQAAGLPHITLHGLRRSFGTLAEWCEVPVGIVAQIQGHKPSAIAEKHYRVRPIDLLRKWHSTIEAWTLEQAGIEFDAGQPQGLRVVSTLQSA